MQIEELRSTQTVLFKELADTGIQKQKLMSVRTVDIKDYVHSRNLEVYCEERM